MYKTDTNINNEAQSLLATTIAMAKLEEKVNFFI